MEYVLDDGGVEYDLPLTGEEINLSVCNFFATYLKGRVPGIELFDIDLSSPDTTHHVIMKYKNKYFDAEVPAGVKDWKKLPYMKTVNNKNKKDWILTPLF